MYVIFPLDELLDLNSARENKRGRATLDKQSHTRHTEEVLPLSQPNQLLPNQLKPPLSNQPKSNLQQPTPSPTKQQKAPPTPPQKPPTPSQKSTLTKTPSKTSVSVTPPSIVVPSQSPSPPVSANVKKPSAQQTVASTQPPPDQVTKRQRSSHSTSTETSSTSSTGAKGKALLSPQGSGGPVANRSSWGGSPVSGPFQESCPDRSGSFRAFKDLTVSTDGNSLKIIEPVRSESAIDIGGSSRKASQPLRKNNSFRSHLSDSCASRPRQTGVEAIRKPSAALATPKQPSPSETPKKTQDPVEPTPPSPQSPKAPDTALPKPGTPVQPHKEKQIAGNEGVKVKQEVPVQSAPPPAYPHHQPLTAAESLRIQQECLSPTSESKANPSNQRHPSGRSNRSGSQKLSDLPPSGIGGGSRGATTGSSTSSKTQGVLGSPRGLQQQQQQQRNSVMASNEPSFRDLTNPSHNESLKAHNAFTFKLVKTVSDFTAQLSRIHEQHAEEIQRLVESFRKKNSELRNERAPCSNHMFDVWESLLQEVEVDSQIHADVAGTLNRQISRPLIEKTFYRKIQSRKVFTHRESFDTILLKTEDMLNKCRRDYSDAYLAHYRTQTNASLAAYFDAHNAYVQQLHATNGMLQEYNRSTLPTLLEELEAVYLDVSTVLADCILCGAHTVANRALEQSKRYESLTATCRSSDSRADVAAFVRCIEGAGAPGGPTPPHRFMPPHLPPPGEYPDGEGLQQEPPAPANLKDELILDRLAALSSRNRHEALKKEAADLERQIAQLQDSQETLLRIQQRNIEANLFNKVNEIQEDLSLKRFDLRVAQVHLSAVKAQKELFASKDSGGAEGRERKMSNSSGGSMKTKWMKAFKSLKTSEPSSGSNLPPGSPSTKRYTFSSTVLSVMANRKNCRDKDSAANFETAHIFQEYTYKKITACDVCHQILRGHSRQGLKCRMCKTNVHAACQDQVAKCQPKSRLLRRQRSTSEIEAKQMEAGDDDTTPNISFSSLIASQPTRRGAELPAPSTTTEIQIDKSEEVDLIYQVLKQAGDLGGRRSTHGSMERDLGREVGGSGASSGSGSATSLHRRHPRPTNTGTTLTVNPAPVASCSAPISPRRQKLNLRMKSFSLDSPESSEQVHRRHQGGSSHISHASSHSQSPSSPVHNRRLLTTRNMRMSSVELPDENEKSLSSASTSPCPSPVSKKPHRLLPTNLYVVLYNFTSRHPDELDLRAGYKVTVIDTSDPDWWQGKCLGRTGYFPSKYVTRLNCGEKPLQVTHNLQVTDGDNGIKLLRDQIVIQIGEEVDGMVMIRNGDNQQGVCPLKYLQEA